jgi:predicted CoA-substrate-specific enzyme activase
MSSFVAGIDAGSRAIKAVLWNVEAQCIAGAALGSQGVDQSRLAREAFEAALTEAGLPAEDVGAVVATGYGRQRVEFADKTITEITCHARGVRHGVPDARTIVEIGGQDSKLIRLDERGKVQDFAMNDRCAAGTGRFLEMVAQRLDAPLGSLGALASQSQAPSAISSMCVVFAETEIIGLLADGAAPPDIVAGVQQAIVRRVAAMAGRKMDEPAAFTGGVALIPGMRESLEAELGRTVIIAPAPQMTGAVGAALLAAEQ